MRVGAARRPEHRSCVACNTSSVWTSVGLLAAGLALVSVSGVVLSGQIERVAERLRLTAGLLGIVSALGADSPEISSAVYALLRGHRDVGVGVVLGSNVYNLAVILGLSALVSRKGVRVGHRGLWLNGGVALVVTLLAALLVLRLFSGWLTLGLALCVFVPYVAASSLGAGRIHRLPLPVPVKHFLCDAIANVERDVRRPEIPKRGGALDALALVPSLVSVVVGSFIMVRGAVDLADHWRISRSLVGILVLSVLTSIPNTIAAVQFARHGRGTAVLSEALNSNSINVLCGLCAPVMVLGPTAPSTDAVIALVGLGTVTAATMVFGSIGGGIRALEGVALLALYVAFVALVIVL
jgi:cation:H+ antiporter